MAAGMLQTLLAAEAPYFLSEGAVADDLHFVNVLFCTGTPSLVAYAELQFTDFKSWVFGYE